MPHKTVEGNGGEFLRLLDRLKDFVIIVEGKKDREALKTLGLNNVIAVNGRPLIKVVNEIKYLGERPVILTDFDKRGIDIAKRLSRLFQAYKIHPNSSLRCKLMEFGKNKIEDFRDEFYLEESMPQAKNGFRIRGDYHVKTGSYFNKIHNKSAHKGKRNSGKAGRNRRDFWPD